MNEEKFNNNFDNNGNVNNSSQEETSHDINKNQEDNMDETVMYSEETVSTNDMDARAEEAFTSDDTFKENHEYNEEESETTNRAESFTQPINENETETEHHGNFDNHRGPIDFQDAVVIKDKKKSKANAKRAKAKKRFASYVAIAAICSILGGGVGGAITYSALKSNGSTNMVVNKVESSTSNGSSSKVTTTATNNLSEVIAKVSKAVVGVTTKTTTTNMFGFGSQETEGVGSGFIFSEDGYVLTNYHVISGSKSIKVVLSDSKEVNAKVVNYSEDNDLAVLKITDNVKMPGVMTLGDSDSLQVGETVIAIGNPLGLNYQGTVTSGIVSAVSRNVQIENKKLNLIQTDAAINEGNSGGPLINTNGEVVGINTAKLSGTGIEGIGFSIPINDVSSQLKDLVQQKLTLGISVMDITDDIAKQYNMPVGVYVREVQDLSVAQKAGIQAGDVITKFDGKTVKTVKELNKIKDTHKEGDSVKIEVNRNGKTVSLTASFN